jgi:phenylpropionate dioxygenase-like ring-hydroxylating dioxygenase large terminal subunit
MGAYFRFEERAVERKLRAEATSGVIKPVPEEALGLEQSGERVTDRRTLIPVLGLREYWYPAIPAKQIPQRKPLYWRMLGEEICFFRGEDGEIGAISDVCPHRGASLSQGICVFKGTVSCPYHGATFDAAGTCKAFLGEGPDSKMAGKMPVKAYPTKVLRGWVFIWMGAEQPSAIEEDVPPELFDSKTTVMFSTYTYWPTNWILAIENQNDSHNAQWAHRNAMMNLTSNRGRSPTPIGPRSKLVNDRALVPMMANQNYYKDAAGKEMFSLHYPTLGGNWPRNWRKIPWAILKPLYKYVIYNKWRMAKKNLLTSETEEWCPSMGGSAWHLPCQVRVNHGIGYFNRFAVPVSANLSRVVYLYMRKRPRFWPIELVQKAWWHGYYKWWMCFNFSGQDARIAAPCRYWTPENLSATDSHLIMLRKLITERSRDAVIARQRGAERQPAMLKDDQLLQDLKRQGLGEASLEEAANVGEAAPVWDFLQKGFKG